MTCGFCGREIPDRPPEPAESCGACPGGCRKVHCPYCGYANPVIPGFLNKLSRKDRNRAKE
jgi:hypothetical protein